MKFCDDGGSSGGGSSGGGGWDSGPTQREPEHVTRARAINNEGVDFDAKGDYEGALRKFLEAAALNPDDPVIQRNIRRGRAKVAFQQAVAASKRRDYELAARKIREALGHSPDNDQMGDHLRRELKVAEEELEAQRKEAQQAQTAEAIRQGIERLTKGLQSSSAGPDFDGSRPAGSPAGGLAFMDAPSASAPPPVVVPGAEGKSATAGQGSPFVDSSVVDLRDRTTDVVDPNKVRGTSPQATKDQGLRFMTSLDQIRVPTPAERAAELRAQAAELRYREALDRWVELVRKTVEDQRAARAARQKDAGLRAQAAERSYQEAVNRWVELANRTVEDQKSAQRTAQDEKRRQKIVALLERWSQRVERAQSEARIEERCHGRNSSEGDCRAALDEREKVYQALTQELEREYEKFQRELTKPDGGSSQPATRGTNYGGTNPPRPKPLHGNPPVQN